MVLIDGGILNPLPLSHVQRTEGDILIAVDVNAPIDTGKKKKVSPYNLLTESSRMMMQQITRYQIERCQPDILIQISGDTYDMLEFHPSRRVGKPEDIARMCLFLCEENNDFINGENITIDG